MKNSSGFCVCLPVNPEHRQWQGWGFLSPSPQRQCQMLATCGWEACLSWEWGSPITRGGSPNSGLISWKLNFPFDWSRNNWGGPLKSGETTGKRDGATVCASLNLTWERKQRRAIGTHRQDQTDNQTNHVITKNGNCTIH